jgi:hypothetical protein
LHPSREVGCSRCWPTSAKAAWEARAGLRRLEELIDESHFHVMILACGDCEQRYVSIFTETIDWEDGEDPQYWSLLPITAGEADSLIQQRDSLSEMILNALGPGRQCLRRDHPKETGPRVFWGKGVFVGPHD